MVLSPFDESAISIFIPSSDRNGCELPSGLRSHWDTYTESSLRQIFPEAKFGRLQVFGTWMDCQEGGKLVFEESSLLFGFPVGLRKLETCCDQVRALLTSLGGELNQGAVGAIIGRSYFEIPIPGHDLELDESADPLTALATALGAKLRLFGHMILFKAEVSPEGRRDILCSMGEWFDGATAIQETGDDQGGGSSFHTFFSFTSADRVRQHFRSLLILLKKYCVDEVWYPCGDK